MEERIDIVVDPSSAKRGIDILVDSFRSLSSSVLSAESATTKLFDKMRSGINALESALFSLKSIALSFGSVIAIFKELGQEFSKFQAFISAMAVSVGGVTAARKEFSFLMDMADRLGISITALQHNYSQLSAAAVGTTLTQEKMRTVFESFSVAARVLHLSTTDTRLMFYALTQMVSKGSVSMEELRRQLGEKLPGAMTIAARSVNATMEQFESAVRKGTVDSAKFLPIFAEEVKKTFGPGLALAQKAYDAEVNRLTNSLQKLLIVMYDLGVADSFTRVIKELNNILEDKEIGKELGKALKAIADNAAEFLKTITPEKVRSFITGFSEALQTMSGIITNDVMPVVDKLAKALGVIVAAWLVVKGVGIGAATGAAVAGPAGTIPGAVTGGIAGLFTYLEGRKILSDGTANRKLLEEQKKTKGAIVTGRVAYSDFVPNAINDPYNFQSDLYNPGRINTNKLSDVLKSSNKIEVSAMDRFIETLKEKKDSQGPEGNLYEGLRDKANFLAKKPENAARLNEALEKIDELEGRGIEYKPLSDTLAGMSDRQEKDTPATYRRRIEELETKYPMGRDSQDAINLRENFLRFELKYNKDIKAEKQVFVDKQDEVIRLIGEEAKIYTDKIDLIGKSANEQEQLIKKIELEKKLEKDIFQLREEALKSKGLKVFDEVAFRASGKAAINFAIEELGSLQEASQSAISGYDSAITKYLDGIKDLATSVDKLVTNAFKSMEDALVEFSMTGKLSFKSLTDSILRDMVRIQIQQNITKPLAESMKSEGGFGGLITKGLNWLTNSGGSSMSSGTYGAAVAGVPSYAEGTDYVPATGLYQLHKGEAVIPANQKAGTTINVYPDLRGASVEAVEALNKVVRQLNASIEPRISNTVRQSRIRGA